MNDSELTVVDISLDDAVDYIDDYLFDLISHDGQKDKYFFVNDTHNIAIKRNDEMVGLVAFTLTGDGPFIHPKVRKEHLVYAKRCCELGFDYLKDMGFELAFAAIPSIRHRVIKMAEACDMKVLSSHECSDTINKIPFEWVIYERAL